MLGVFESVRSIGEGSGDLDVTIIGFDFRYIGGIFEGPLFVPDFYLNTITLWRML